MTETRFIKALVEELFISGYALTPVNRRSLMNRLKTIYDEAQREDCNDIEDRKVSPND